MVATESMPLLTEEPFWLARPALLVFAVKDLRYPCVVYTSIPALFAIEFVFVVEPNTRF